MSTVKGPLIRLILTVAHMSIIGSQVEGLGLLKPLLPIRVKVGEV